MDINFYIAGPSGTVLIQDLRRGEGSHRSVISRQFLNNGLVWICGTHDVCTVLDMNSWGIFRKSPRWKRLSSSLYYTPYHSIGDTSSKSVFGMASGEQGLDNSD